MNRKLFIAILIAFSFQSVSELSAQPQPPGGGSDPPCWPPPCIPIDGGLGFLIAAGVAYGGKKAFDITKKKKVE